MNKPDKTWAILKPDVYDLLKVFPDRQVPILSIYPILPSRESSPLCFLVDPALLSGYQLERLAYNLHQTFKTEIASVEQAKEYIGKGLPLACSHFQSVSFLSESGATGTWAIDMEKPRGEWVQQPPPNEQELETWREIDALLQPPINPHDRN